MHTVTGLEHNEMGRPSDLPEVHMAMSHKRHEKLRGALKLRGLTLCKRFGDEGRSMSAYSAGARHSVRSSRRCMRAGGRHSLLGDEGGYAVAAAGGAIAAFWTTARRFWFRN